MRQIATVCQRRQRLGKPRPPAFAELAGVSFHGFHGDDW
jgi:hypothetical protein